MTEFWLDNPSVLLTPFNKIPYGFIERLNYIFAIAILISLILVLIFKGDLSYILIAIIIGGVTIVLKHYHIEDFQSQELSKHNPYNNPSVLSNVPQEQQGYVDNDTADELFYSNTFQEYDDIYQTGLSRRQFYTIPGPTIPNDRDTFANWLYNNRGNSCKQGNSNRCLKNINLHRTDLDKVGNSTIYEDNL